jgi:isopenicillin-N N-acyltransferase-like protein
MTRHFASTVATSRGRGEEFGETHRAEIARTIAGYDAVFSMRRADATHVANAIGTSTLHTLEQWSAPLAEELHGMADGAAQSAERLAGINARTEVLAALGTQLRGECSTVVFLGDEFAQPVAMQNWDWFAGMADNWLVWTIPHEDGRVTTTVTEYGILGKIGINSAGVGVLFNILHHTSDGTRSDGVPVHLLARQVLDSATDANTALAAIAGAQVNASTAMTVVAGTAAGKTATTAEVWPHGPEFVLPNPDGLLLHTNHFLASAAQPGDTEPRDSPDTLNRYEVLQRSLHPRRDKITAADVREVLTSHVGDSGAICCHPAADAAIDEQYATLATVELDFDAQTVVATAGNPCLLSTGRTLRRGV